MQAYPAKIHNCAHEITENLKKLMENVAKFNQTPPPGTVSSRVKEILLKHFGKEEPVKKAEPVKEPVEPPKPKEEFNSTNIYDKPLPEKIIEYVKANPPKRASDIATALNVSPVELDAAINGEPRLVKAKAGWVKLAE